MKRNYHTHNELCGHAEGTIEDYVKAACGFDMEELGLSDHIPFEQDDLPDRMRFASLEGYCRTIEELKEKYSGRIKLFCGFEAEHFPARNSYYEKLLTNGTAEYLLLGQHYFIRDDGRLTDVFRTLSGSEDAIEYAKAAMAGMATGYFKCLAHPDLFMLGGWTPDRNTDEACDIILNEAVKHDYVLELNANGLRHKRDAYPSMYFWKKAAQTNVRVIIGADAHKPEALGDEAIKKCEKIAKELHLNLIDNLL